MALGDRTKCKTCFVCPRMVLCGPRKDFFFKNQLHFHYCWYHWTCCLNVTDQKNFISFQNATLEFLVEFAGCRWETHSEAFGIRSSGTEEYNTWSSKHQSADCRFPFKVRQDTMESPFPKEERSSYLHCCVWILWGRNYWASVPILSKYRWLQHWHCLAESFKIKPQMPGSTTVDTSTNRRSSKALIKYSQRQL